MNKKILLILFIILVIVVGLFIFLKNNEKENNIENNIINEITPEEEISVEQQRETMITLYFQNIETGNLEKESRKIDAKKLNENPYSVLVQMLIDGPTDEKLQTLIPKETKINDVYIKGNVVYVDLSKEFVENEEGDIKKEENIINSMVDTLTELNEVTYLKILIDGSEEREFKSGSIKFNEVFKRND